MVKASNDNDAEVEAKARAMAARLKEDLKQRGISAEGLGVFGEDEYLLEESRLQVLARKAKSEDDND
ncbi:hypothetical protein [Dongia sp. agr-C8]